MLRVVNYSEKVVALIGDTFSIKDEIKKLGGTFNKSLSIENTKVSGWIFPSNKKQEIESFIKSIPEDKLKSNKPSTYGLNDVKNSISIDLKITHEMFANLLNKYEMLEARVEYLESALLKDGPVSSSVITKKPAKKEVKSSRVVEEEEEEEEEKYTLSSVGKQKRLLD